MNVLKPLFNILLVLLFTEVCYSQYQQDESLTDKLNKEKEAIDDTYGKKIKKGKLPFDGEWTDAWNNSVSAGKGIISRQYSEKYLGRKLKYAVEIASGIKYIEPGVYRSNIDSSFVKIINNEKILVIGKASDFILVKVKLEDEKWFNRECDYFLEKNKKREPVPPYLIINNVSIKPEVVAPGKPFNILIDYMAADIAGEGNLPIRFTYSILQNGRELLQSPEKKLMAVSGQPMNRIVNLNASPEIGKFEVRVNMKFKEIEVTQNTGFEISDDPILTKKDLVYTDIEGKYELTIDSKKQELSLISTGNVLQINHKISAAVGKYNSQILSYNLNNKLLTFSEKSVLEDLQCWYIVKIDIDFSSPSDDKPVKSTVVDGNWCVMIGQTFKGTLRRKKE
jgi:hypothetical protein